MDIDDSFDLVAGTPPNMGVVPRSSSSGARLSIRVKKYSSQNEKVLTTSFIGSLRRHLDFKLCAAPKFLWGKSGGKTPLKDLGAAHNLTSKALRRVGKVTSRLFMARELLFRGYSSSRKVLLF